MLNSLKSSIKHLKVLNVNYSTWKYIDTRPSVSKADRIKELQKENKLLFGKAIKKSNKKKGKEEIKPEEPIIVPSRKQKNDLSSEIYWMCHNPAQNKKNLQNVASSSTKKVEPPNPDDPFNIQKLMKSMQVETIEDSTSTNPDELPDIPEIKISKKKSRNLDPSLPETLKILQSTLPKSNSSNISTQLDFSPNSDVELKEIPFTNDLLRSIQNFPMILTKNSRSISSFENIDTSNFYSLPSVSKVLQTTMPESQRQALINWKNLKIAELGIEGFEILQKGHLTKGKEFHGLLQKHFEGETVDLLTISPEVIQVWMSIEPLLDQFHVPATLIEEKVKHPFLCYQGVVDCVSIHKSSQTVIEWKKSDRQKKSLNLTFDAPLQLCSYIGALNASREEFKKNPIQNGIVVVAYSDGQKADIFELNENELKKYWKLWLNRLQEYWVRYRDDTLPNNSV